MDDEFPVEGTLHVTDDGTIPAPDWYEDYEGPVDVVTPALTVGIESRETLDSDPRKLAGETAPFPMEPTSWHHYGSVESLGVDEETARKIEATQPDGILFDLGDEIRLYHIDGLHSFAARNDC